MSRGNRPRLTVCLALAGWLASAFPAPAAALYRIDQQYGGIVFSVSTFGLFTTEGKFPRFEGELLLDTAEPERSHIDVTIDAGAVELPIEGAAELLRSDAYFDTAHHPTERFVSTSIKALSPEHYVIHGMLRIRGVMLPQKLDASVLDRHVDPERHVEVADFVVTGRVSRSAFGMVADRIMISDTVKLDIRLHLTLGPPPDGN